MFLGEFGNINIEILGRVCYYDFGRHLSIKHGHYNDRKKTSKTVQCYSLYIKEKTSRVLIYASKLLL